MAETPLSSAAGLAPVAARGLHSGLFVGLACLGDLLLLRAGLLGQLAMTSVMALHVVLALLLGAWDRIARGRLSQATLVRVVLLLLFGPLGGPALMVLTATARQRAAKAAPLAALPMQAVAAGSPHDLYEQIRQGRRHPHPQQPLSSFHETFLTGSLHRQQAAIAAISRSYHPHMRPALAAALASPVPALRVQAAAVHARLRGGFQARAKELLALDGDAPVHDRALAGECERVAASGFVDARTEARLLDLSARLARPPLPPPAEPAMPPRRGNLLPELPVAGQIDGEPA